MSHDLPNLQDLAHEGRPNASNGLRPVLGEGGLQHDAGAFVSSAQDGTGSDGGGAEGVVARQGHLYQWQGRDVIAMESGAFPKVAYIDVNWSWVSQSFHVKAADLVPQPMKYFGGSIP